MKHNAFFVHEFHVVVHGVGVHGHGHAQVAEVAHALGGAVMVDDVAVEHEQDHVELQEDLRRGLVDRSHHRPARVGQPVQEPDQVEGSGGVESGGRLVQEDQRGVDQQLHADRGALLLAARESADEAVADVGLGALLEAQRVDHALDQGVLLGVRLEGQPQVGDEAEGLARREGGQHEVLLHHVADHALVVGHGVDLAAVDADAAPQLQVLRQQSPREQVQHGRLARAGRTQDGGHRVRLEFARALLQDSPCLL